ncbi:MAG: hypothetical protein A2017_01345 [Lentisphaerae bacterium GWF2_44_16]|nr:MAG: hypothetical protein A2017_01345 [Lentisphaerae bacterium GWF2_44_16]
MSKENVKMFFAELERNPELKAEYMKAIKEYDEILAGKLIEIGNKAGFSFTDSDFHDFHIELMNNENGELNDADLMKAAGGNRSRWYLTPGWRERQEQQRAAFNRK